MLKGSSRRRLWRGQQGAVSVEFALVLPLLVMLLMGIITGGLAYFDKISTADAMREGARFGATTELVTGWSDAVKNRTVSAATGSLDTTAPGVVVCVDQPGATGCPTAPSTVAPAATADACYVHVYVERPLWFSIGLHDWNPVVKEDAYARYERTCP